MVKINPVYSSIQIRNMDILSVKHGASYVLITCKKHRLLDYTKAQIKRYCSKYIFPVILQVMSSTFYLHIAPLISVSKGLKHGHYIYDTP